MTFNGGLDVYKAPSPGEVRELLTQLQLTQTAAAELLCLDLRTINRYVRGDSSMQYPTLYCLLHKGVGIAVGHASWRKNFRDAMRPLPRYAHNCHVCKFFGQSGSYDLYLHTAERGDDSIVIRHSDNPNDQRAGTIYVCENGCDKKLREAYSIAKQQGVI